MRENSEQGKDMVLEREQSSFMDDARELDRGERDAVDLILVLVTHDRLLRPEARAGSPLRRNRNVTLHKMVAVHKCALGKDWTASRQQEPSKPGFRDRSG